MRLSERYSERLLAGVGWWVFGAIVVATFWLAFAAALGRLGGVLAGLTTAIAVFGVVAAYGAARVSVDATWLRAGQAKVERRYLGPATPLTAEQAQRLRGPDANPRAWLLIRPYIPGAVTVEIRDGSDPTPYWLISSRHPERLADALNSTRND